MRSMVVSFYFDYILSVSLCLSLSMTADMAEECILAMNDEIPLVMQYLHSAYVLLEEWFEIVNSQQVVKSYKWYR